MKKQEKIYFVDNLSEELKDSKAIVLVNFEKLGVLKQQDLKAKLKEVGATLTVVKNTLLKRAGEKATLSKDLLSDSILQGPTALVSTDGDPVAPLQVLGKFISENEVPQFKVGVIEGSFQDKDGLTRLSKLPGKNVLFAQLLGALSGPATAFVYTLSANQIKLVTLLKNRVDSLNASQTN